MTAQLALTFAGMTAAESQKPAGCLPQPQLPAVRKNLLRRGRSER